ncbi:MAG: hypothetical protein PVJ57_20360 [Phycisphaerae bacterium]|jgi:hypothetical protein
MFEMTTIATMTLGVWLVSAYWFCLILGGGLLLISALGGGDHDADVDVGAGGDMDFDAGGDVDFDASADVDFDADAAGGFDVDGAVHTDVVHAGHMAEAAGLSSWFSIRFLVFFVAAFGALGVVFTHLTPAGSGLTLALALVGGAAVGQGVHRLFRLIRRTSGNSATREGDYVRKLAHVTVRIAPPDPGEVSLPVRGVQRYVPATAMGGNGFNPGDEVVVVDYRAGVAQVISREQFEREYRSS